MTDIEKLQRAKIYCEKLARGVNPITDGGIEEDSCVNDIKMARCFIYISDVLETIIENSEALARPKKTPMFYIMKEQLGELSPLGRDTYASELTIIFNDISSENDCRKFQASWLSKYFVTLGCLEEYTDKDGAPQKRATKKGADIGIRCEPRTNAHGRKYTAVIYNDEAQKYIFSHMTEIIPKVQE